MQSDLLPRHTLTVRIGCALIYETAVAVPLILNLKPRRDPWQALQEEKLVLGSDLPAEEFDDAHGNIVYRLLLQPGRTGRTQVEAVCDWVHANIEYRFGSGSSEISAWDVLQRGYGVCRDFAHLAVALRRSLNLPARYVTGHLPDIGYVDPGSPMDFHAYFEVYLDGRLFTYDARFNLPRIGRVKVSCGLDAVDGAFATVYGPATLSYFEVWAYQVPLGEVTVGSPIDLSKRLDGTAEVRGLAPAFKPALGLSNSQTV